MFVDYGLRVDESRTKLRNSNPIYHAECRIDSGLVAPALRRHLEINVLRSRPLPRSLSEIDFGEPRINNLQTLRRDNIAVSH
jgi:hypothetical protein